MEELGIKRKAIRVLVHSGSEMNDSVLSLRRLRTVVPNGGNQRLTERRGKVKEEDTGVKKDSLRKACNGSP